MTTLRQGLLALEARTEEDRPGRGYGIVPSRMAALSASEVAFGHGRDVFFAKFTPVEVEGAAVSSSSSERQEGKEKESTLMNIRPMKVDFGGMQQCGKGGGRWRHDDEVQSVSFDGSSRILSSIDSGGDVSFRRVGDDEQGEGTNAACTRISLRDAPGGLGLMRAGWAGVKLQEGGAQSHALCVHSLGQQMGLCDWTTGQWVRGWTLLAGTSGLESLQDNIAVTAEHTAFYVRDVRQGEKGGMIQAVRQPCCEKLWAVSSRPELHELAVAGKARSLHVYDSRNWRSKTVFRCPIKHDAVALLPCGTKAEHWYVAGLNNELVLCDTGKKSKQRHESKMHRREEAQQQQQQKQQQQTAIDGRAGAASMGQTHCSMQGNLRKNGGNANEDPKLSALDQRKFGFQGRAFWSGLAVVQTQAGDDVLIGQCGGDGSGGGTFYLADKAQHMVAVR